MGGLGLTITAADRVIIVDPAWNPAVDNQSVDRAYRIGQARRLVVYRLITSGTVEEKIYRRQVYKAGLASVSMPSTADANPTRYGAPPEHAKRAAASFKAAPRSAAPRTGGHSALCCHFRPE